MKVTIEHPENPGTVYCTEVKENIEKATRRYNKNSDAWQSALTKWDNCINRQDEIQCKCEDKTSENMLQIEIPPSCKREEEVCNALDNALQRDETLIAAYRDIIRIHCSSENEYRPSRIFKGQDYMCTVFSEK